MRLSQRRGKGGSLAQRPSAVDVLSRAGRPILCAGRGAEQEVVPKGYLVLGPIPGQGRVGPKPVEVQRSGMPDPSHSGCEPRPRVRLTRLGRGPGAEGWSEELAMGGTRVLHGVPVWQG